MDESTLSGMAKIAREVSFGRNELIFQQGDPVPGIYIVTKGLVRVFKTGPSGKEHVLHLAGPGMTFAEIAVMGQFPCPAFAETVEETECLLLPTELFLQAIRKDPSLCLQILAGMAVWVRSFLDLMDGIVLKDAVGRVAMYLLEEARRQGTPNRVALPGLKKHIASHLNLTSETLSRTLRQLKEGGLIEEPSETIVAIPSLERLNQAAEGNFPRY